MIIIGDSLYIDIKIDGQKLPVGANLISGITLCEGNGALIPSFEIVAADISNVLIGDQAITDGNVFEITVGQMKGSKVYKREYRLYGQNKRNLANGPQNNLVGVLNVPKFYAKSNRKAYKGLSSSALSEIAGECGLKFVGPDKSTDDQQDVWLNVCSTRANCMNEIARYGYIDENSVMSAAVTSLKELRYKNITDIFQKDSEIKFVHNVLPESGGTQYRVVEAKDTSHSSTSNNWMNYGAIRREHRLDAKHKSHKDMKVKTKSPFLSINSDVSDEIEKQARIDYMPIDCGNHHTNYWKALYQNQRGLAMLSERVSVLIDVVSDVQLYDLVVYRQADADVSKPVDATDYYIVYGKTIFVKGGTYYAERIELANWSATLKGSANLAGG